jgi:hypothetical protein
MSALDQLHALRTLEPNWDGEPCDPPTLEAIERARPFVQALSILLGDDAVDVDADVLGGVYVHASTKRSAVSIAIRNTGSTVVIRNEAQ